MRIRTVKTASGKHALQVVSKRLGVLKVHKHIGTYADDREKAILFQKAQVFIKESTGQISFTDHLAATLLSDIIITQSKPLFAYQFLSSCYDKIGFNNYEDEVIKDLIIARLYHPASKRGLQDYLYESLGRHYSLKTLYRHIKKSLDNGIKERFQEALISFARKELNDTLQLVFYDVTTLYFDSAVKTTLKDFGFSKDHRPADTQVVVGLVVNKEGFPLYFDVFSGKTFEGHTFVAVVKNIQKLLAAEELVVVADAAMLSQENIEKLVDSSIGFIVGARLANLPMKLFEQMDQQLQRKDMAIATLSYREQRLICQYSEKRAAKDRHERTKHVEKAKTIIANPAGAISRYRFVKKAKEQAYAVNTELIEKAEKLEGIKGYVTNTSLDPQTIIDRYHDLWRIENSFRITKSDLEARPIFHRLDETIKAHMVIVFAGLAIAKYIEIKTDMSIKKVLQACSKVLTHTIKNNKTGETIETETTIEDPHQKILIERLRALGH